MRHRIGIGKAASGWIAARTHRGRERLAAAAISEKGHESYLPEVWNRLRHRREVLFPSYIFVLVRSHFEFLFSTRGIAQVLMTGNQPSIIAPALIAEIRSRENESGCVLLPERFELNQPVKIKSDGLFKGQAGLYQGLDASHRARVLLTILGAPVIRQFDQSELAEV